MASTERTREIGDERMKVLVTGAGGQLGRSVVSLLNQRGGYDVSPFTRLELDIANEHLVASAVESIQPDVIFHCAAYTNVEAAEDTGKELNWKVNRDASGYISKAATNVSAKLIYISTDYVFDGLKSSPYEVTDTTNPLNQYGAAKLAGEQQLLNYSPDAHVIRTSWVFEEEGQNFVNTMERLAETMDSLKVVNDQHGRPTYAPDLAEFMLYVVEQNVPGGIYHFANDGEATWYAFAKAILRGKDIPITPVDSKEFVQKAKRPQYSVLSLDKVKGTGFELSSWQDALARFQRNQSR